MFTKDPKFKELFEKIKAYNPNFENSSIERAYKFAQLVHKDQKRKSGEPFFVHPVEVSLILAQLKLDPTTIEAALLHDTVEDTSVTIDDIKENFGNETAEIVEGLTKISKMNFSSRHENQAENFRKMLLAMAKDLRVLLIKLADRLHNMRTLEHMHESKQRRIAEETLDIYAPLANRLGISWIKLELEDLCLRYLKPETYYKLVEKINKTRKERDRYIHEVINILDKEVKKYKIKAEISGRPKHFYSIYRKMETRNLEFEQIHDLIAFRAVVDNITECYEVLGVLHSIWKPVPGRFKDYIAIPKPNLYQSLHTTLIGPHGERVEVQIRTGDMHDIAEVGVAAHWAYKEGKNTVKKEKNMKLGWLNQLMEWQSDLEDPTEFLQTVKVDLFPEEVYVFTPRGEVKDFPKGATPIDFAYSVHSDVGYKCTGAKVNGRIVPLKYKLQNGETIEILTSEHQKPNKDWLSFVVTSKAKTKIRQVIKSEQRDRSKALGKEILDRELRKFSHSLPKLEKAGEINKIASQFKLTTQDEIYIALGYGKIQADSVVKKLYPEDYIEKAEEEHSFIKDIIKKVSKKQKSSIVITGIDDILTRFGKCCNPVYGDAIVGYITRGRGVTIHTTDCSKALEIDPARKIDIQWNEKIKTARNVKIRVVSIDTAGLLAKMTKAISNHHGNIVQANIRTTKDKKAINTFEINIKDTSALYSMLKDLEKINGIISAERVKN
ncbi:MAG: bifunctional (p)ppGpp synthetase/guanosine-3',5'-bis(diphosphate) 3'-pyrophosphohydrolase [Pseudomonadota bacterium]